MHASWCLFLLTGRKKKKRDKQVFSDKICLGAEALSHTLSSLSHFGWKLGQSSTWMQIQQQVGAYTVGCPVHSGWAWELFLLQIWCLWVWGCNRLSVYCVKNGALEGIGSCFQKNIFIFSLFCSLVYPLMRISNGSYLVQVLCLWSLRSEKMLCNFCDQAKWSNTAQILNTEY